jgi:transglutaminase-like putative cysteine protease
VNGHRYEVAHKTEYVYSHEVTTSYGRAYRTPVAAPGQRRLAAGVSITPGTEEVREHVDFFGNVSTYFAVFTPHLRLTVIANSLVEVNRPPPDFDELDRRTCREAADALDSADLDRGFRLPSAKIGNDSEVAAYAAGILAAERPLGEAVTDLVHRIYTDFRYVSGATNVGTTLAQLLADRRGVCQDFAHLAVGCLRSVGLAARYVSGYLETSPPPGQPKLQGADATHAWASVLVPGVGWVDLDPTNDTFADNRYIVLATGRDYADVPPLKGIILSEATHSTLAVGVDVVRLH